VSAPNIFKYENRLKKAHVARGGMSRADATHAAEAKIEAVRAPTIAHIDAALATIMLMREDLQGGPDPGVLSRMYDAANRIVATAGLFDLGELGEAAYCLCELVSRFQAGAKFSVELVQVCIEGLRLLRDPGRHSAQHREAVLVGLNQVVASVNPVPAAS
jgi:hypothetical protein